MSNISWACVTLAALFVGECSNADCFAKKAKKQRKRTRKKFMHFVLHLHFLLRVEDVEALNVFESACSRLQLHSFDSHLWVIFELFFGLIASQELSISGRWREHIFVFLVKTALLTCQLHQRKNQLAKSSPSHSKSETTCWLSDGWGNRQKATSADKNRFSLKISIRFFGKVRAKTAKYAPEDTSSVDRAIHKTNATRLTKASGTLTGLTQFNNHSFIQTNPIRMSRIRNSPRELSFAWHSVII